MNSISLCFTNRQFEIQELLDQVLLLYCNFKEKKVGSTGAEERQKGIGIDIGIVLLLYWNCIGIVLLLY